jgi:hypothetical protein
VRFSALTKVRAPSGSLFTSWFEIDAATDLRPCFGINLFIEEERKIGKGYGAIGKAQSLVGFPLLEKIAGQDVSASQSTFCAENFCSFDFPILRFAEFEILRSAENIFAVALARPG